MRGWPVLHFSELTDPSTRADRSRVRANLVGGARRGPASSSSSPRSHWQQQPLSGGGETVPPRRPGHRLIKVSADRAAMPKTAAQTAGQQGRRLPEGKNGVAAALR